MSVSPSSSNYQAASSSSSGAYASPTSLQYYLDLRRQCPISCTAIIKQSELISGIATAKKWLADQRHVGPMIRISASGKDLGGCEPVYRLFAPAQGQASHTPIAFFKKAALKPSNLMEELMWNAFVWIGYEDMTAATKALQLPLPHLSRFQNVPGSIQPTIQGTHLVDVTDPSSIPFSQLTRGIIASGIFGMYDAHSDNIFVSENGDIIFFDNCRSLPNSNGYIMWNNEKLISSSKCNLITLPDCYEVVPKEKLAEITRELERVKAKSLRAFFQSPNTQKLLEKMGPMILDPVRAIDAVEERIENALNALKNGQVCSLTDLYYSFQPQARFTALLAATYEICMELKENNLPTHDWDNFFDLPNAGQILRNSFCTFSEIKDLFQGILKFGYDPSALYKDSINPELSLWAVLLKVKQYVMDRGSRPIEGSEQKTIYDNANLLLEKLMSQAAPDYKDCLMLPKGKSPAASSVPTDPSPREAELSVPIDLSPHETELFVNVIINNGLRLTDYIPDKEAREQKIEQELKILGYCLINQGCDFYLIKYDGFEDADFIYQLVYNPSDGSIQLIDPKTDETVKLDDIEKLKLFLEP